MNQSSGVLLIGHGTRDEAGTEQFFSLGQRLAERVSPMPIESALLEFQTPTIPEAWDTLVTKGVRHIHVAPLLLFAAGHAKQDIPEIVAGCRSKTPGVSFDQSRPLSRHPSVVDLVLQRVSQKLGELPESLERTAVVMVGRGSVDPCAQADMKVLSELVSRRVDAASTVTAFYAMAEPRLSDVLERVASSGRFDAVAVYPHLLFEGRLYQSIIEQAQEAAMRHPSVRIVTSGYLGPDKLVADAIAARIGNASNSTGGRCR